MYYILFYNNYLDNSQTNISSPPFPFSMSGDGVEDVTIPSLFISQSNGLRLLELLEQFGIVRVLMTWATPLDIKTHSPDNTGGSDQP